VAGSGWTSSQPDENLDRAAIVLIPAGVADRTRDVSLAPAQFATYRRLVVILGILVARQPRLHAWLRRR
jgi:hypothetical protein